MHAGFTLHGTSQGTRTFPGCFLTTETEPSERLSSDLRDGLDVDSTGPSSFLGYRQQNTGLDQNSVRHAVGPNRPSWFVSHHSYYEKIPRRHHSTSVPTVSKIAVTKINSDFLIAKPTGHSSVLILLFLEHLDTVDHLHLLENLCCTS